MSFEPETNGVPHQPAEPEPRPDEGDVVIPAEPVAEVFPADLEPEPEPPPPKVEPVAPAARLGSVDFLRGIAVLGILAMNINEMAWPWAVYENPTAMPDAGPVAIVLWAFNHLVFDTKMMTLFSMLFGAGLVLMDARAEARGAKIRGIYYRRTFWLLVIGCVHAYLIWDGDILVWYALSGFVLYLFRRKTPKTLLIVGTILVSLMAPLLFGANRFVRYAARVAPEVEAKLQLDIPQSGWRMFVADKWAKMNQGPIRRADKFKEEIQLHRGTYPEILAHRAQEQLMSQTFGFLFAGSWLVGGRMLIGMGLMKLGVFSAERSNRFYAWFTVLGYGIGLPLVAFDTYMKIETGWSLLKYDLQGGLLLNMLGGIFVVLGHVGLAMLIWKSGILAGAVRRLSAVGRMALSNYLFDSIVCTTLFYGYGFGLYGKLDRGQLYLVVLTIWAFQLFFSTFWLKRFRYGPAEWVWRTLTYWSVQPMRYAPEPKDEPASAEAEEPAPIGAAAG